MSFNDILVESGGFGVYQKFLTFGCLMLTLFSWTVSYWTALFILLIPPHRCKLYFNDTEWISNLTHSNELQVSQCHINEGNTTMPCSNGIVYDFSIYFPTYVSENNLVCEDAFKVYLTHTVFWSGTIFGFIIFGFINDKYGRRRAYQIVSTLILVADVTTYFSHERIVFNVARFFSAAGMGSITTIGFVLVIEHCIPEKRRHTIFVWSFTYSVTSFICVWIGYFLFSWRYILMFSCCTTATTVIMSFFLPESPSWLLTRGRLDEAVYYVQRMARINGKNLNKDFIVHQLQKINEKDENKEMSCFQTIMAVAKLPNLTKRIICLAFMWFAACACYNGNNLEFNNLPFNMYITYSIGAFSEVPGNFIVIHTLDKFGRRWINAGFFISGGLFGVLSANIGSTSMIIFFVMIMRASFSSAFDITFSFSSEAVPTIIRGRAISFIRTCGGVGSTIAPLVVSLAQKNPLLPLNLFGIIGIAAGLLMLTLPETANQHLPQTLEEGEHFGKEQPFWFCPSSLKHSDDKHGNLNGNAIFRKTKSSVFEEKNVQVIGVKNLSKY